MIATKKFTGLLATALIAGGLIGCGGNGSNPSSSDEGVTASGGIQQSTAASTTEVPASDTTQLVTLGGASVLVPPTATAIPAGTEYAVLAENIPIISNTVGLDAQTRAFGDTIIRVLPNGPSVTLSGLFDRNFQLTRRVGFGPGSYQIEVDGPWEVTGGFKSVTTQKFVFDFTVNAGKATLPTSISGVLPANGTSTGTPGTFVSGNIPGVFAGTEATLKLTAGQSSISKTVTTGSATGLGSPFRFEDLVGGFAIPQSGLDSIYYSALID